jgi:ABC-type Mn2+/Zn2+ transport system ATPase subunit
MNISIKNCNNIREAIICIEENHLNIKYGINGTGKSTIAKAIEQSSNGRLDELMPFMYRDKNIDDIQPTIDGVDSFSTVLVFNEEYINQFVFQENELLENSFNIFIKDAQYIDNQEAINTLIENVKIIFNDNDKLNIIIKDLEELSSSFGKSKDGYAKSGKLAKSIGSGNKLQNIPQGLEEYSDYLHSENNVKWLKWQIDGSKSYLNIKEDKCPYCTTKVEESKKEMIKKVSEEYNATAINHLVQMLGVFERLNKYFSDDVKQELSTIIANSSGLSTEEISYLIQIKEQIETLLNQLKKLQKLSFHSFKDINDVEDTIKGFKINLGLMPLINSDETQNIISPMNDSLDSILERIGELKGKIHKQKQKIQNTILDYQEDINSFLEMAGYKYQIAIEAEQEEYKMKLKHIDYSEFVKSGSQHLSFGERNAFALILYMYECLSKNPDLIILDDPISSFDKNKKYAIMYRLFRGEKSFKNKTVLMLTHDIEPIIDTIKIKSYLFQPIPKASFLKIQDGIMEEIEIIKSDLITFSQVCKSNLLSDISDVAKTIYLRRYYEIMDDKGLEYHMLSSLQHSRTIPTIHEYGETRNMNTEEIDKALEGIQKMMSSFDYSNILTVLNNKAELKNLYNTSSNNYEKLQLFRLLNINIANQMVDKFVKETYHIENELISQLNPLKYDIVPYFIIEECNKCLNAESN